MAAPEKDISTELEQAHADLMRQRAETERLIHEKIRREMPPKKNPGADEKCAGVQSAIDPWQHRTTGMRCKTCMWFVPKFGNVPISINVDHVGRCRRHAPTMTGYPAVFESDWCGDHKLDENKR